MPIENRRKSKRGLYKNIIRYSIYGSEKINASGMFVDISVGGVGMITDYPLEPGNIIVFEKKFELRTEDVLTDLSVVRWVKKIGVSKYRVGLEFVK